jgi:hypothetical protein
MVVSMKRGKLEESEVLSWMKLGILARMGAKIEKKPKLIACETTVTKSCSHL